MGKWLPIILVVGILGWLWWKKRPVTTVVDAAAATGQKVTGSPSVPTKATPTNAVIVPDALVVGTPSAAPTPEAVVGAIQTASKVGQTKVVADGPTGPLTIDVPSVVAAAAASGQTLTDWYKTYVAPKILYAPLPTDPAARAAVIQQYTDVKAAALQKLAAGYGWDSLTPAEHAAANGTPIENWYPTYIGTMPTPAAVVPATGVSLTGQPLTGAAAQASTAGVAAGQPTLGTVSPTGQIWTPFGWATR